MIRTCKTAIESWLLEEKERWLLWFPVAMGLGVWSYFAMDEWVSPATGPALILIALPSLWRWKRWPWLRGVLWAVLAIGCGLLAIEWQYQRVQTPIIERSLSIRHVTGTIAEIIEKEKGVKLVISEPEVQYLEPHETPNKVRVSFRKHVKGLEIGQRVSLRAGLFPLPEPALPGGFDFARHFYFQGIGAVGFGLEPVEILASPTTHPIAQRFKQFRRNLAAHIRESLPQQSAAVAVALITGERAAIPDSVRAAMRDSGLAHMLAISGLHLGLVAGVLFIMLRYLFVVIPGLSLRFPIKKWAAFGALLGSFGYLAIAGFPVSAQRAYVMAALVLSAIMFDRMVLPMRSLALAAILILFTMPESLLSPSFQLSFAATMAILALFEGTWYRRPENPWRRESLLYKPLLYFGIIFMTSLVAGLATAPFVAFHFNQITAWHILANLAASPFLSLWVMPLAVCAVLAMPFGIDGPVLWLMGQGIEYILSIAMWVSSLPHAISYVPALPDWGMALIVIGGCWLCFWRQHGRWLAVPMVLVGLASGFWIQTADIFVSAEAKQVAVRVEGSGYVMVRGSSRDFKAGLWQEALGLSEWTARKAIQEDIKCDRLGCILSYQGQSISLPLQVEAMDEDCGVSDVIISSFYHKCDAARVAIERPKQAVSIMMPRDIQLAPKVITARSFLDRLRSR